MVRSAMKNKIMFLKRLCDILNVAYQYLKFLVSFFFFLLSKQILNSLVSGILRLTKGTLMNKTHMISTIMEVSLVGKADIEQKTIQSINDSDDNQ